MAKEKDDAFEFEIKPDTKDARKMLKQIVGMFMSLQESLEDDEDAFKDMGKQGDKSLDQVKSATKDLKKEVGDDGVEGIFKLSVLGDALNRIRTEGLFGDIAEEGKAAFIEIHDAASAAGMTFEEYRELSKGVGKAMRDAGAAGFDNATKAIAAATTAGEHNMDMLKAIGVQGAKWGTRFGDQFASSIGEAYTEMTQRADLGRKSADRVSDTLFEMSKRKYGISIDLGELLDATKEVVKNVNLLYDTEQARENAMKFTAFMKGAFDKTVAETENVGGELLESLTNMTDDMAVKMTGQDKMWAKQRIAAGDYNSVLEAMMTHLGGKDRATLRTYAEQMGINENFLIALNTETEDIRKNQDGLNKSFGRAAQGNVELGTSASWLTDQWIAVRDVGKTALEPILSGAADMAPAMTTMFIMGSQLKATFMALLPAQVAGAGGFTAMASASWALLTPWLPLIGAVALLGASFVLLEKKTQFFSVMWEGMKTGFKQVGGILKDSFGRLKTAFMPILEIFSGPGAKAGKGVEKFGEIFAMVISGVVAGPLLWIIETFTLLIKTITTAAEGFKIMGKGIYDGIYWLTDWIIGFGKSVGDFFIALPDKAMSFINWIGTAVSDFFTGVWNSVKSAFEGTISFVKGIFLKVADFI